MSVKPNTGYGYHAYGHNSCKEVTKKTCYNVPVLTVVKPAMNVICSEPLQTCVNKPINLPRISYEGRSEEECITVPEIDPVTETCENSPTPPMCQHTHLLQGDNVTLLCSTNARHNISDLSWCT